LKQGKLVFKLRVATPTNLNAKAEKKKKHQSANHFCVEQFVSRTCFSTQVFTLKTLSAKLLQRT